MNLKNLNKFKTKRDKTQKIKKHELDINKWNRISEELDKKYSDMYANKSNNNINEINNINHRINIS